ncbi:ABC transporter permease [Solicola gregarius]|uniref:ABC3 transporter permease C-terminal domain-containing protein n=1 Tax=Solicola gregarius TaxID=2908642 RepID=A0AA46YLT0_9ACTN|nr:FtsX-like permease family protein [Solicola gregarius]UYM05909.1 hypothetical protein L0C25_02220 [Solicola gregarius]
MSRTLRAVRAAPTRVLSLGLTCAFVVAGTSCVVAFPAAGDARTATVATLLGIGIAGCLATASIVSGSLREQASDIRLAAVRGYGRGRMWRWLVSEPLLVVTVGSIAGLVVGAAAIRLLVSAGHERPDSSAIVALSAVGAGVVCATTVAVCCRFAGRMAFSDGSVGTPVWRASAECIALVGCAWLLVTAASAGLGESPMIVALAPLAAALAAVIVSGWLSLALGAIGIRVFARTADMGRYLAVRRLRRTSTLALAFAAVAGAVAMAVFGLTVRQADAQWRDDVAAIATGGVDTYDSEHTATATFLATRAADPDGRWLMTIEGSPTDIDPETYNGFADLTRWERVLGTSWHAGSDDAPTAVARAFREDTWNPVVVGDGTMHATIDGDLRWPSGDRPYLNLSLLRPDGEIVSAGMPIPEHGGDLHGRVRGCSGGCVLRKLQFATQADAPVDLTGRLVVRDLTVGGKPVAGARGPDAGRTWSPDRATAAAAGHPIGVRGTSAGLEVELAAHGLTDAAAVVPSSAHLVRRVVAAGTTRIPDRVGGLDPAVAPSEVVARSEILPLIGTHGYLGNLADIVLDSYDEPAGSRVRVLARSDTPASVLAALGRHGVDTGHPLTPGHVSDELADSGVGRSVLAWCVLAAVVAVVAVSVAIHAASVARPRTRRDDAALRSAHVPMSVAASSARYEVGVLSVTSILSAVAIALVTWWCTRHALVLALPGPFDPAVDVSTRGGVAAVVAVPTLLVTAGAALLVRRRDRVRARPEILRRSAER